MTDEEYYEFIQPYEDAKQMLLTRLDVLNHNLYGEASARPIHNIQCRIKKKQSIEEKLQRKKKEPTVMNAKDYLQDIAGVRVICYFVDDIYNLTELLKSQSDLIVIRERDYIGNPKPNGYRSYHVIVGVPVYCLDGMVGPHWSKGWIIEDCEIYESKCSGISLGKYLQPENDNKWLKWKYKDGTQTERDCICQASYEGWDKEHIGSHIVRRCEIHDCGQTGIVGHLGGVFSVIEDNHIHHINNKQNLAGAEIGGIKMHAAIDVIFRRNHIHNCTRGLWLDWQAQGTRVTGNLFHDNALPNDFEAGDDAVTSVGEDIFVEVSHGPTLIDHNILLSDRALKIATQGVALVHNLICGGFVSVGIGTDNGAPDIPSPRYTPYHTKHGTQVAGFMTILHGDDRFYNNIFVQKPIRPCMQELADLMGGNGNMWDDCNVLTGTFRFNGYPTFDEWNRQFEGYCGMGSETTGNCYYDHLPVWASGNLYFNGARAWEKETDAVTDAEHTVDISVEKKEDGWYLKTNLYDIIKEETDGIISTETLGMAFEPEQKYENPDGSQIIFNQDFFGNHRDVKTVAGPFTDKKAAEQKLF